MKIYVPEENNFSSCYVVMSSDTIRGYQAVPTTNSTINYRDYYINSNYLYKDGTQTFSQYSTIPVCLSSDIISHDVFYRNDIDRILIIFIILLVICFYFPYKIIKRILGKWGNY